MRVFAMAVALGLAAPAYAEVDASKIEKARRATLSPDFQDELPGHERVEAKGTGTDTGAPVARREPRAGKRVERTPSERRIDTREYRPREQESGMSGLMTTLMWGLIAVGLGLLAFWFVSEMTKSDRDVALPADDKTDAEVAATTAAVIDRPLGDADDLAAQGKFAEAIHTLLLRTLHELARSAMVRVERSHTSREILARVPLAGDAREALSVLITYVELTHFGDDPAGPADYAKCREQFNRFATAFKAGLAIQRVPAQPQALAS